ncbi:mannose-6-phosphate isomerase, class I [Staphylococcus argenteus]|uniref:mannose-6-phosphate isomerase, class I n=1 Tax=Staphylococcus argenteus TaxID=985002 RepID=UPI001930AD1E|nr:mannose-6-phosphate isomerase, class I [Staphylococcus argenteus]MBE2156603.1 mannose-6-phosphate isomerase, class I [Staphylococcus argenteus]
MALFLQPVFKDRIWGGHALKSFNYDIPNNTTGECWAISAHPNGPNTIMNGPYQGMTLDQLWMQHRELFNNDSRESFPLLTKVLDANDKLSVQVHPDDDYALKHEGELGKTECWYILDAVPDAEIIYGVHAQTKDELIEMIDNHEFDRLFKRIPVKPGDFYYVPAGTVHAIGSGILILETQQSSDTTYRIYDYDRRDQNGQLRDLHLEQSKNVIQLDNHNPNTTPITTKFETHSVTRFVDNNFFAVYKWNIHGQLNFTKPYPYCLVTIIEGTGTLTIDESHFDIQKGISFILTTEDTNVHLNGEMSAIISHPS